MCICNGKDMKECIVKCNNCLNVNYIFLMIYELINLNLVIVFY